MYFFNLQQTARKMFTMYMETSPCVVKKEKTPHISNFPTQEKYNAIIFFKKLLHHLNVLCFPSI